MKNYLVDPFVSFVASCRIQPIIGVHWLNSNDSEIKPTSYLDISYNGSTLFVFIPIIIL
jgi:hypothetical protein